MDWSEFICLYYLESGLKFIEKDIVCCYGLPKMIITENTKNFNENMIQDLNQQWKINHLRPKMNGIVEVVNKNIKKIMQKIVITYKGWHECFYTHCMVIKLLQEHLQKQSLTL
jgi:hypothetical protein